MTMYSQNTPAQGTRTAFVIVGSVVFLAAFLGLIWNHLDSWPESLAIQPAHSLNHTDLDSFFTEQLWRPSVAVDAPVYKPWGAFEFKLRKEAKWKRPMGEKLCIIDLDNRPWDEDYQIFGKPNMTWSEGAKVHGQSLGILQHWLYARIHGYKYYYIRTEDPKDRRTSWMKAPIISKILKDHDVCVYQDSDTMFHHPDLPMEWLMNYWDIHPESNSLALAVDPDLDKNKDKFGKLYLNTGFIIAQNNPKTFEIMQAWWDCPSDHSKHPGCKEFRFNDVGRPTDQGAFGTYVRYDFASDIKPLPCSEANGYPESSDSCKGKFIKHLWTGKASWIKIAVGEQIPGAWLEIFHQLYKEDMENFFQTQAQLLGDINGKEKLD